MTTATRNSRTYGRPRHLVLRLLLTMGLVAPAAFLFVELVDYIDTVESTASRELLGVEYLRGLEPVAGALGAVQTAVVSGASPVVRIWIWNEPA